MYHHVNNAKNFLGRTYVTTKGILRDVDHGFRVAKQVYAIAAPTIQALAGHHNASQLNRGAMKAISGYDSIRSKIMDAHDTVQDTANQFSKIGLN